MSKPQAQTQTAAQPQPLKLTPLAQPPLAPGELIALEQGPDGVMNVRLSRYGKCVIALPNTSMRIEVHVARTSRGFVTLLSTSVNENEKHHKETLKANGGKAPGFSYVLAADGKFRANNPGNSNASHNEDEHTSNTTEPAGTAATSDADTGTEASETASASEQQPSAVAH